MEVSHNIARGRGTDVRFQTGSVEDVAMKLLAYCQANDWAGYDPYDALNSKILESIPFLNHRLPRLVFTQALKRVPFNLRRLLLVPKTQNPKGLALFLKALLKLGRIGLLDGEEMIGKLTERIVALRSPGVPYWCWGYSFPWQTRTIVVPRGTPNLVCTTFVADALLDAYEASGKGRYLEMAVSSADYIRDELYWTEGTEVASLSYPLPALRTQVHNANFLGAALLCRIHHHVGGSSYLEPALKVARYSAARQHEDGAWNYGEASTQRWIDNFHTGYNLCALRDIGRHTMTEEFESCVARGFEFYRSHFFREDHAPRYFHNRTYPIDIHSVAQSIITLLTLRDLDENNVRLTHGIVDWATAKMWDDAGYFHYRLLPFYKIRTSYMRWSQAWMLLALATLLEECGMDVTPTQEYATRTSR